MVELNASVIVLDLDDTLYLEREFAFGGFASVGRFLEPEVDGERFALLCANLLESGARGDVFDQALRVMGHATAPKKIEEMVAVYRSHRPDIALCEDAVRFLDRLGDTPVALISDGPEEMQRAKLDALKIGARFGRTVLTGSFPGKLGKPHPRAFLEVMVWSRVPSGRLVYIADNAAKDFFAPRALGWQTIQIQRRGRIHDGAAPSPAHEAQHCIESFDAISLAASAHPSRSAMHNA